MFNFIFKFSSKFQFIKTSLILLLFFILFISLTISNNAKKLSGLTIFIFLLFIFLLTYYISKWLKNND